MSIFKKFAYRFLSLGLGGVDDFPALQTAASPRLSLCAEPVINTKDFSRRSLIRAVALLSTGSITFRTKNVWAAALPDIHAYRNPGCGCCAKWAEQMKSAGFAVTMVDDPNLDARRVAAGVPPDIVGCHTAYMGDYLIEGHVPATDIKRLLAEKRPVLGLAVPGMPAGSPGMENGAVKEAFKVLAFQADGSWFEFANHG